MIASQQADLQRAYETIGEFAEFRGHAEHVARRALDEAEFHCDEECPMRTPVYLLPDDGLWHLYPRCSDAMPDGMVERRPCPECAQEWITPYVPNRTGTSLSTVPAIFGNHGTAGTWDPAIAED